ncbi:MAG TPA: hypothetical protein VFF31_13975 [Blastocatellia bacterium]|nr:hypothetical protein [Blastocatellia bacterium]
MKRVITLSVVLALGVLLLLANFLPTTQGQQPQSQRIHVADTGIITLSRNQMLRLTVTGDWDGDVGTELLFRRLEYAQVSSSDGVRKTTLASQTASDAVTLAPGEDVSFDIPNIAFGVRGVVSSNRPDVRVTAQIINRKTGEVQAFSVLDDSARSFLNEELVTQARRRKVTIIGRINEAMLTAPMIQTILSIPRFSGAVAIQGNTITVLEGNSLWLLSNGGYALVVAGEVLEPTPYASEIWTKDMGNGDLYVAACFCPGPTANPNDGCEFDGAASRQNCKGPACCAFKDGIILGTGTPILF